jgi:hypothetical protein
VQQHKINRWSVLRFFNVDCDRIASGWTGRTWNRASASVLGHYAYAIEIGKALIDFGFHNLGLEEVIGLSVNVNLRVSRLAERYGFQAIDA